MQPTRGGRCWRAWGSPLRPLRCATQQTGLATRRRRCSLACSSGGPARGPAPPGQSSLRQWTMLKSVSSTSVHWRRRSSKVQSSVSWWTECTNSLARCPFHCCWSHPIREVMVDIVQSIANVSPPTAVAEVTPEGEL